MRLANGSVESSGIQDEQEPQAVQFQLLQERKISSSINAVACSPVIDLLAFTTNDGQVHIYRFITWQRLSFPPGSIPANAVSLKWSPNGRTLVLGHTDGSTTLLNIENGDNASIQARSETITALEWREARNEQTASEFALHSTNDSESILTEQFILSRIKRLLPKLKPESYSNELPVELSSIALRSESKFSLLVTSDHSSTVSVLAYANFHLCQFSLSDFGFDEFSVARILIDADLTSFTLSLESQSNQLFIVAFQVPMLATHKQELRLVAYYLSMMEELQRLHTHAHTHRHTTCTRVALCVFVRGLIVSVQVKAALKEITNEWNNLHQNFASKLQLIDSASTKEGHPYSSLDQLLMLLICGVCSSPLNMVSSSFSDQVFLPPTRLRFR